MAAPAADTAAVRLGHGINAYSLHDYTSAIAALRGLPAQLPRLADYATYYLASSELQNQDAEAAARDLAAYTAKPMPSSPLEGKIALLYGRALLDLKRPAALGVLQTAHKQLPQPDGDFALARAYELAGERLQAVLAFQKVYFGAPANDLANQARNALDRLREALGRDFPEAPPEQQLERPRRWIEAKDYYSARQEYSELAATLPEPARDAAKVGVGEAQYMAGEYATSFRYLKDLKIAEPEADARRLYYLEESARQLDEDAAITEAVGQLDRKYHASGWRFKALVAAGNRYAKLNRPADYTPLFKAASDDFPGEAAGAAAHWRLAWDQYLVDGPERTTLLREQIERYPSDSRAGTALYYLGRIAERTEKPAEARALYERLSARYPHYYYAVEARKRLAEPEVAAARPDKAATDWLDGVDWPERRDFSAVAANPATRARIERARLLMLAGLADMADAELRFGAATGAEQTHLLALELARGMPTPFHAMRIMKSFSSDYLAIPFEGAPRRFWLTLFPLPYRDDITRDARAHGLDPFQVAALIRQETEFNPSAKSYANAYGLMQLMPATGRMLARQQGIRMASVRTLLDPTVNIQLGTAYMKQQLDHWDGDWVKTLAAYNAGPGRVNQWRTSISYREPSEYVEAIPIDQTREYVQAVLRNADVYRTLYGGSGPKMKEVADLYDVPPVNLTTLPAAARTPGGGVKTAVPRPAASHPASSHPAASHPAAKTPPKKTETTKTETTKKGAPSKTTASKAAQKKTTPDKKRDPAG